MTISLRNMSVAFALMVSTAPLMAIHVDAKASFMAECSAKFKAAKAANSLGTDTKWTDFMKHQCAADASASAPVAPAAPAVVAPAKVAAPVVKPVKPAAAATTAAQVTTPSGSFMQNCSAAWKSMKASNTVPAGMKWKDFIAAKCVVDGAAAPATTTAAATTPAAATTMTPKAAKIAKAAIPAEPTDTNVDTAELKTVDKNGKPFTPGQMAAHVRIKTCANNWRAAKASNSVPSGQKWPQFWSACNTQLKASAQ